MRATLPQVPLAYRVLRGGDIQLLVRRAVIAEGAIFVAVQPHDAPETFRGDANVDVQVLQQKSREAGMSSLV